MKPKSNMFDYDDDDKGYLYLYDLEEYDSECVPLNFHHEEE